MTIQPQIRRVRWALVAVLAAAAACAEQADDDASAGETPGQEASAAAAAPASDTPAPIEVAVTADDFTCIRDMTPVRGFFVDNVLGDLDATLAVANSETGGAYPPGSLVQLVPSEAMLKREPGFSEETNDWEFFELAVSDAGTEISVRGTSEAVNRFGGNCLECHAPARDPWDMICEQTHGCLPIPITPIMSRAIQKTDPRCEPVELTAEEGAALAALAALIGGAQE